MLSDPYLPNGSMSPLVSAASPHGEVLWSLSLVKCVTGIFKRMRVLFILVSKMLCAVLSKLEGEGVGRGKGSQQ